MAFPGGFVRTRQGCHQLSEPMGKRIPMAIGFSWAGRSARPNV